MKPLERLRIKFQEIFNLENALPFILFLLVVFLISLTWPIWSNLFSKLKVIFMPFIIGFIIAYVLRPIAVFFERYKIPRSISITVTIVGLIALIVMLFSLILPSMYDDLMQFSSTIIDGLQQVYDYYKTGNAVDTPLLDSIFKQIMDLTDSLIGSVANLPALASNIISKMFSAMTTAMFSIVIGIYFIFDYEKISKGILDVSELISPKLSASIVVLDESVSSYMRSFLMIMPIVAVEYSLMYFIIGHNSALILGVLTAISLLVPLIGPLVVHVIGVITALSMPRGKVILLIVALTVLSNIDGYVISPLVYSKRNKVEPLWSLFAFFTASTLFGFVGVLISMPLYISIRSILELRSLDWDLQKYQESREL